MTASYRIDDLGWVQFERLCEEVLRLEGLEPEWEGRADLGRVATVPGGAVAVVWIRSLMRTKLARASLVEQIGATLAGEAQGRPLRLLTNLELTGEEVRAIGAGAGYVGPHELSARIDQEPLLRRRVPSVLGVRDLEELIPPETLSASTGDVDAAGTLARVFVPTRAYARALRTVERHRFGVLTGPPEMGKTAIARMIGLALLTEGWELHECVRPDDLWARFSRDRAQVFVADDAFGSTEYRPEAAERWALELDRVLQAMDERHWLIWTSRPAPLKAALRRVHREHGVEHWPQPGEVHVAADELDVEEKALILYRHTRAADAADKAVDLVQRYGWQIVSHRHFTPERIRRFVGGRLNDLADSDARALRIAIDEEIREPTTAMATSLRALEAEHRALLVALLDVPPGPVAERELASAARRHVDGGIPKPPAELVDRLTDHFLRVVPPTSVTWVHPSWRDLVIEDLAADAAARRRFLARCSVDGLLLALSTSGGPGGARVLPLLVDDADWDTIAEREHELAEELADEDMSRLLSSLASALDAPAEARFERELRPLAGETLDVLRRRWDTRHASIPPGLLNAWLEISSRLEEPPALPDLRRTWLELVPHEIPDVDLPAELDAFDDWLKLGGTLREHVPEVALELGFPQEYREVLSRFVSRAGRVLERDELPLTAGLLAQVLRRLVEVAPEAASTAAEVARSLTPAVGEAFDEPPVLPPDVSSAATTVVARILSDLA